METTQAVDGMSDLDLRHGFNGGSVFILPTPNTNRSLVLTLPGLQIQTRANGSYRPFYTISNS